MRISFVILHYNALEVTIKCVESIQNLAKMSHEDVSIIVVDNCSPNGTGDILKKKYENTEKMDVLLLGENIGFARGNNAGFVFANKKYSPDFIVLSNNDIMIEQTNFIDKIVELYYAHNFAVLGPNIYSPYKGIHQNPLRDKAYTADEVEKLISDYKKKIKLFKLLDKTGFYSVLHNIKRMLKKKNAGSNFVSEEKYQVVLHGAFLIMSRNYINAYPMGLCDKTFMYMEEDILYYLCLKNNLKLMYSPELQVIHNEGASTRNSMKSRVKKSIFEFENTIESAHVLLDILKDIESGETR